MQRLRDVLSKHEKQYPRSATARKKESRFHKAVRLQMQIQI